MVLTPQVSEQGETIFSGHVEIDQGHIRSGHMLEQLKCIDPIEGVSDFSRRHTLPERPIDQISVSFIVFYDQNPQSTRASWRANASRYDGRL